MSIGPETQAAMEGLLKEYKVRAEKAESEVVEWKQITRNVEASLKQEGERWVKAMTERDAAREDLAKLRNGVKPLLQCLGGLPYELEAKQAFLTAHPELKESL